MKVFETACLLVALAGCVAPPRYAGPLRAFPAAPAYPAYGTGLMTLPENVAARTPVRTASRSRPAPAAASPATTAPAAPLPAPGPVIPAAAPAAVPGPECRTVTQVGYADGREVQRQERFCRAAPGREWVRS